MTALSSGSLADLLAFAAWPDEMQKVARAAVSDEFEVRGDDAREELRDEGREDQQAVDQNQFATVHEHLDEIVKRLTTVRDRLAPHLVDCEELIGTVHGLVVESLERLAAIPDELADVQEPAA